MSRYYEQIINGVRLYIMSINKISTDNDSRVLCLSLIDKLPKLIIESCKLCINCNKNCSRCILSDDINNIVNEYNDLCIPVAYLTNNKEVRINESVGDSIDGLIYDLNTRISKMYGYEISYKITSGVRNRLSEYIKDMLSRVMGNTNNHNYE